MLASSITPNGGKEPLTQFSSGFKESLQTIVQESVKPCQCSISHLSKTEFWIKRKLA